jgi:hypothetical protein
MRCEGQNNWILLCLSLEERHHRPDYLSSHATGLAESGNQLAHDVLSLLEYLMPGDNLVDYFSFIRRGDQYHNRMCDDMF